MAPFVLSALHTFAVFLKAHLPSIAVGIISTFLVLYGEPINKWVRRATKGLPFLGRFALFVFLCSFGYGLLSSQAVKLLRDVLQGLPDLQLVLAVCGAFVVLGFLARSGKDV